MSTQEIIEKYNEMLHDGKHTFEQAYGWMMMEKNKQDHEFYLKQECTYVMIMHFYIQNVFFNYE